MYFFFSSRRRHTRCALVTGVQTCALPIYRPSFDLKEPTDRAALGNFIVKAAQDLKSPLHFLRHAAIAERWQQHRANFWDRTGRPKGADESIDWDGMEQASLRSEEHTSELQSLMRISYAVFCLKKKKKKRTH